MSIASGSIPDVMVIDDLNTMSWTAAGKNHSDCKSHRQSTPNNAPFHYLFHNRYSLQNTNQLFYSIIWINFVVNINIFRFILHFYWILEREANRIISLKTFLVKIFLQKSLVSCCQQFTLAISHHIIKKIEGVVAPPPIPDHINTCLLHLPLHFSFYGSILPWIYISLSRAHLVQSLSGDFYLIV